MNDLGIIYYSACRITHRFADAVRFELLASLRACFGELPAIACVTHAYIGEFGTKNIVVSGVVPSIAQVYRNVLLGAQALSTMYVAFAEDDTLYVPEHWTYRPALDTFAYNERRAVLTRRLSTDGRSREALYFENPRTQMAMGICSRELLIETLTERFAKHPNPPFDTDVAKKAGWGEPGRYEKNLGLPRRKLERFPWTERPSVTVNHAESLMGRRAYRPDMRQYTDVEPWGNATALWNRIHG